MSQLKERWKQIEQRLRAAQQALPQEAKHGQSDGTVAGTLQGTLEEFEEFLSRNELELAWDALAAVASRTGAASACWTRLAEAASLMGLMSKETEARGRAATAG